MSDCTHPGVGLSRCPDLITCPDCGQQVVVTEHARFTAHPVEPEAHDSPQTRDRIARVRALVDDAHAHGQWVLSVHQVEEALR